MNSKRKSRQTPSNLPRQTETQLPLLPDAGIRKKVVSLPDGQEEVRAKNRAAAQESRNLERFLKRMGYTEEEWELRRNHYLREPRSEEELRSLTWKVEKKRVAGAAVEVALERQKKLSPDLWMVGFLMADGVERTVMPLITHLKQRRVDMLIAELRSVVRNELQTDTDSDGVVTRWFLGL
jgi:hypothetical protein